MTNRLGGFAGKPKTLYNLDQFMEKHLADFIKSAMDEGCPKDIAIKWATERFERGGKHNLQEYATELPVVWSNTGEEENLVLKEGMVFGIDYSKIPGLLEFADKLVKEDVSAATHLLHDVHSFLPHNTLVIWRMYTALNDMEDATSIPMLSCVIGAGSGDGKFIGVETRRLLISSVIVLLGMEILTVHGHM